MPLDVRGRTRATLTGSACAHLGRKVSVGEPAEGSLSKRTEAPARVAAASPGNRPPLALVEVKTRPLRRSTRHKSFTGDTLSIDVLNANSGPRVNPGTTPASGSSEKQSRCACRPGECGVGRRPVSPPSRRSQQGFRHAIGERGGGGSDLEEVSSFRQVAAIDRERTSILRHRDEPIAESGRFWSAPELWRIEFVCARVADRPRPLIEASSHSGVSGPWRRFVRGSASSRSRVVWECSPKRRTSAGREPRPAGRRSEGRAQGNSPSGECYRRAIVTTRRPAEERSPRLVPSGARAPVPSGESAGRGLFSVPGLSELCCGAGSSREAHGVRGLMSATFPTRLETRTKESNMCASRGAVRNPQGRSEGECRRGPAEVRPGGPGCRRISGRFYPLVGGVERERACRDPKDGELCLKRLKPEETLVEDRSDSDVQIDRQIWV
ncbi:unnamed protein product [Clavelina lepadiformis]|uniref:Uncharacterized protein n=1 Tax=Clavelina lepadiformis TaxID=159417 RepID=A0ABP0FMR5_CLALP